MVKNQIIKAAKELGIEEIGFSSEVSMQYLKPMLEERTVKNFQSEFEEKNTDKRLNANLLLENCSYIICAVFPYANGYHMLDCHDMGRISVSSFGIDYHKTVHEKLESLAKALQGIENFNYKICVDTAPLLDRAICARAGLGFIGKNNMLINNRYGSFVFLGYIITDICLNDEEDKENIINENVEVYDDICDKESYVTADICKTCNTCLKECPNHAIIGNGIINAKRCISYLTQTKNYIEIENRKAMGHQIYGCDVCQYFCPKNKHVIEKTTNNNYNELLVDLKEIMTMTNREYNKKYGHIAGSWRGKNIWKRNAIIAAANSKLNDMYDLIKNELYTDNEMMKVYAIWALMEIDKERSTKLLDNFITGQSDLLQNEYNKVKKYMEETNE